MKYVKLCEVADLLSGFAFKSKNYVETGIRIIRIANVQDGFITDEHPCFYPDKTIDDISKYLLNDGDLLVSLTGNVGRIGILKKEFLPAALNQRVCCIRIKRGIQLEIKYLYYYWLRKQFVRDCIKASKGVAQLNLSTRWLENYPIPFPDLDTQNEIIIKIEESMSQLDSAVATLKKTKQQLEIYRQAVLKEAFQGFYTSVWRKKHPQEIAKKDFETIEQSNRIFKDVSGDDSEIELSLPNSWEYKRIGEAFEVEVGATPSRQQTEYWNGNIHWVSSGEVRFNTITETEETITENGLNNSSTNLQPVGTVLLAMIGEGKTRGKTALLGIPAAHNQNTAAILVSKTPCSPKYLYYFLMMNYDYTRRVGSGNNQKALNKERVRAIHFPFAPFSEQKEVVWEIETRLALCDKIDQTVNQSLQQAEALRQSILIQAFEGV